MSRNNLIIVVRDKRGISEWFYVIVNANADNDWNHKKCKKTIKYMKSIGKRTKVRATALILAHDIDRKLKTEYGVREMSINY